MSVCLCICLQDYGKSNKPNGNNLMRHWTGKDQMLRIWFNIQIKVYSVQFLAMAEKGSSRHFLQIKSRFNTLFWNKNSKL